MSDVFGAGEATAGIANAAAIITVGILQYKTWQDQIDKADAIARRIQDREDDRHRAWKDVYQQEEVRLVQGIFAAPEKVVNYGAVRQRVEAAYRSQTDRAISDALFFMDNQCAGARADVARELSLRGAGLTAFGVEAALRAEETRIELQNRQALADKITAVNTGRQAYFSPSSAMQAALQQHQFAAQQAAGAFNGAVQALGALARRNEQRNGRQEAGAPALRNWANDQQAAATARPVDRLDEKPFEVPALDQSSAFMNSPVSKPGDDPSGGYGARDYSSYESDSGGGAF